MLTLRMCKNFSCAEGLDSICSVKNFMLKKMQYCVVICIFQNLKKSTSSIKTVLKPIIIGCEMNSEINSLPNQIYFDQPPFSHQIHGKTPCVKSASFLFYHPKDLFVD